MGLPHRAIDLQGGKAGQTHQARPLRAIDLADPLFAEACRQRRIVLHRANRRRCLVAEEQLAELLSFRIYLVWRWFGHAMPNERLHLKGNSCPLSVLFHRGEADSPQPLHDSNPGKVYISGHESGQLVLGAISWKVGEGLGTPHRLVPLFLGSSCSFRHHSIRELLLLLGRQG